ncbi:MAG: 30S ribosomal protein S6, partial [Nanoarchaeota archaeon]
MTEETLEETTQRIEKYEIMLIFNSDIGEEGAKKELSEIKKNIEAEGGEIFTEDFWGTRDLTYRIKKQDKGFYVVVNLTLPTESVKEIEKMLNLHPLVVRFLLLKTPANYQLKTFEEYKVEEEAIKKEEAQKKEEEAQEKKEKFAMRTKKIERPEHPALAPKKQKEEKVEKVKETEEVKEVEHPKEIKEEKEPEKIQEAEEPTEPKESPKPTLKKSTKSKLEEMDEKLKSIIDNPDIT